MSFGWSSSDIVCIAKLAYDAYTFCREVPADLQGLSDTLNRIGHKLDHFSSILDKSGLGSWKQAPDLKQHLRDTHTFLEPLRSFTNRKGLSPAKVKWLIQAALKQDELRRIEKTLAEDERAINDIKIDLILMCALENVRHGINYQVQSFDVPSSPARQESGGPLQLPLTAPSNPLRLENKRPNSTSFTVSDASRALDMAVQVKSQPKWGNSIIEPSNQDYNINSQIVQTASDFVTDVASLVEDKQLYSKDVDPSQSLDELKEIAERARGFQRALDAARGTCMVDKRPNGAPVLGQMAFDSFGRTMRSNLFSEGSPPSQPKLAFHSEKGSESSLYDTSPVYDSTSPISSSATSLSDPHATHTLSNLDESRSEDSVAPVHETVVLESRELGVRGSINLRGRSKASLNMSGSASLDCCFQMGDFHGQPVLNVVALCRQQDLSDMPFMSGAVSTSSSAESTESQTSNECQHPTSFPLLQHCLQSPSRPIPHLLHPSVEGPAERPSAPYTITFTDPQKIIENSAVERHRWTTTLMYVFFGEHDRNTMCEAMFGKSVVMTAGSNKIVLNGRELSHLSAIVLWFDPNIQMLSMTFFANLPGKGAKQKDIHLEICGLRNANKTLRSSNTVVVLAKLIPRLIERTRSFSGQSITSRTSSDLSQSFKVAKELKCVIEFSQPSDKTLFVNHVKSHNIEEA